MTIHPEWQWYIEVPSFCLYNSLGHMFTRPFTVLVLFPKWKQSGNIMHFLPKILHIFLEGISILLKPKVISCKYIFTDMLEDTSWCLGMHIPVIVICVPVCIFPSLWPVCVLPRIWTRRQAEWRQELSSLLYLDAQSSSHLSKKVYWTKWRGF